MSSFEEFTKAVAKSATNGPVVSAMDLSRIAVLGGGHDAMLLSALCLAEGAEVTLFSAYGAELESLRASSGITLRGAGPVGTYNVDRENAPSVKLTAELDKAVAGAQVIFLTGPIHKQRTYAMVLADHLADGQILVLAPGRSLGALETAWFLRIGGCSADVTLVETQGLPYWYDAKGTHLTLSEATAVAAATLPSGRSAVLQALARYLPNLDPKDSVLASGFADGSAIVEFPALLMGGPAVASGAVEVPMGGTPLAENNTFAALLGPEQRDVIARMFAERVLVARSFGVRDLPDADAMIAAHAGAARGAGARVVPDADTAKSLLRDGVLGSLVPLVSAAKLIGAEVPTTQAMITLASTVLGADVAAAGRRLETIGIDASDVETARRAMDAIATGAR